MSEFTEKNWKNTLALVYDRSLTDSEYRSLCVSDPYAAIKQVSDIELPAGANIQLFADRKTYIYAFLLPPVFPEGTTSEDIQKGLLEWATNCTDLTTHGP